MKKKKVISKKSHHKQKKLFRSKLAYLIIGFIVILLAFIAIHSSHRTTVLGTSTSISQQSGSSFHNMFSSFFSMFSGKKNATDSASTQEALSNAELLTLADDSYSDGNLPLGDKKYVTDSPKKGYVYLCNVRSDNNAGGAQTAGSWIHGNTWNIKEKIAVQGQVTWQSQFSNTVSGTTRKLSGNDLPNHTTGVFPIQSTDPAYQYDRNPNTIKANSFTNSLPVSPTYSAAPYCMGGEAGVMLTGVILFNGFDAGYRDAAAYEVQDSCNGHPERTGEYHYHSLSSCITDVSVTKVIGFALDGFPITGPKVADHKFLTTDDLDECHGVTSSIVLDGKAVTMYHYVMTQDFPYSISCFRGKPVSLQVISNHQGRNTNQMPSGMPNNRQQGGMGGGQGMQQRTPPQAAFTACSGKSTGTSCSFIGKDNTISGICQTPPGQTSLVCVPSNMH